ncbi:MAG: hypothetical protein AB1467_02490 [Candidatus Diapherotrites archaeon]
MAEENKTKAINEVKQLELELHRVLNAFGAAEELNRNLSSLYEKMLSLEKSAEDNPALSKVLIKEINERKILSLYKKLESSYSKIMDSMKANDEKALRANLFIENFRNSRNYLFKNLDHSIDFIEAALPLFSINSISFKPEFVGVIKLEDIAREVGLDKSAQSILVPQAKVRQLFNYLDSKTNQRNFRLESEVLKITMRSEKELQIEADNAVIRRLDRLAKQMDGNYSEE